MAREINVDIADDKICWFLVRGIICNEPAEKVMYTKRNGKLEMFPICRIHKEKIDSDYPGEFVESAVGL